MRIYIVKIIKSSKKILIITRGVSGSGKSTLARQLAGKDGAIFSTDDLFINPSTGKYEFDPSLLGKNHALNFQRAEAAMTKGITPVVIDNTSTRFYEMKKYVEAAQRYGYKVEFREPETPWAWNADELAKRNTHGVPRDAIQKMIDRFEKNPTVEKVLQSRAPWEK